MVEFRNNRIEPDNDDDYKVDALAIANAFRAASDDDTRNVMNVMANQTPNALEGLKFYAVPASWMVRAWPILTAGSTPMMMNGNGSHINNNNNNDLYEDGNWRERIGIIQNALLVDPERTVSDDEGDGQKDNAQNNNYSSSHNSHEEAKAKMDRLHRRLAQKLQTRRMKPGLIHTQDYFFLGPSAWVLLKEKFGFDGYVICRSCCKATPGAEGQGAIAISLLPREDIATGTSNNGTSSNAMEENSISSSVVPAAEATTMPSIEIPASGRFAYERIIPKLMTTMESGNDDDGDHGNQDTAAPMREDPPTKGNVVSFADEREVEDNKEEEPPILLLPSSTTAVTQTSADYMELEPSDDKDSSTLIDDTHASGRKRLASGLGNLGNTCFMNTTLQCLANTEGIRRYFLSGEYERDLNKDNPLGTGGELATQFAQLLGEMWGVPSKRRNVLGNYEYRNSYSHSSSSAVYPRSFKYTVGKHAEQFMGYDQHDSQEFATYLLDALHEDTNRITKKPYIEKPEQGEDEPDDVAAEKAWRLHLQREDSRVLENFMGQIKSRLECCEDTCNRVSTTFDPFMYLSVPIPGSTDRKLPVIFVPLDPNKKIQKMTVTVPKVGKISDLLREVNEKLVKLGFCEEPIPLEDMCATDVWSHDINTIYENHQAVDLIQDRDKTYIYQLRPLKEIQALHKEGEGGASDKVWDAPTKHRIKLDLQTMTKLNLNDQWMDKLADYTVDRLIASRKFLPLHSTHESRMEFHKKLENFLDECHLALQHEESDGVKQTREEGDDEIDTAQHEMDDSEHTESGDVIQGLVDRSDASSLFDNVKTKNDVAILEFCANKLRSYIIRLYEDEKRKQKVENGVVIQVSIREANHFSHGVGRDGISTTPIMLRLPGNATVYDLRKELAKRLCRSLVIDDSGSSSVSQAGDSRESSAEATDNVGAVREDQSVDARLQILRRTPLTYGRRSSSFNGRVNFFGMKQLGMIEHDDDMFSDTDNEEKPKVAIPSDELEKQNIMAVVGKHGGVCINWDGDNSKNLFDSAEHEATEILDHAAESDSSDSEEEKTTVLDCIKQYCQKEQLEETEMWYCNKCKNHVRAWKQFHLYRTPPILMVHLKRFYFSASSHRRDKITTKIDFPLKGLDLTELVADYGEHNKPIYDCYGVSNHYGGLGGGHYTAYVLNDEDGTWSYYDDTRITTNIDPKEVVSSAAYVLYYRRRDVPVGQDRDYNYNADSSRQPSPMSCENADAQGDQRSEISSNNTAQAGDMDVTLDDMASNASSRTATSAMGSVDHNSVKESDVVVSFYPGDQQKEVDEGYRLQ